jgi:adenylyltransferase/sulfurtransferase
MLPAEISPRDLALKLENGHVVRLIDVRQPWEHALAQLRGSVAIPLNELPHRLDEIPAESAVMVVVYCHHGVRSLSAVNYLRCLGYHHVRSLAGGIDAWSCDIDPTMARY